MGVSLTPFVFYPGGQINMTKNRINGFAALGDNGSPEFNFNKYLDELSNISNWFNKEIRVWVSRREHEDNKLFFVSEREEDDLGILYHELHTKANQAYDNCLVQFRRDWSEHKTKYPCRLPAMAPVTCQIRQLNTVLATLIATHKLANNLNPSIYRNVRRNQILEEHYRQILENVTSWKVDEGVPLKVQLLREVALLGDAQARQLFLASLQELFQALELEFRRYYGFAPFGCQTCLLCDAKWSTTIFSKTKNQKIIVKIEEEMDPQYFCVSLLRETFYEALLDFIDWNWNN